MNTQVGTTFSTDQDLGKIIAKNIKPFGRPKVSPKNIGTICITSSFSQISHHPPMNSGRI